MIKLIQKTATILEFLNETIGHLVSWLTLGMVVVTFLVVTLRYGFDIGWIAMQESITYMHAIAFMLGAAYTLKHDGHVRVDIFYRNMSPSVQAWINVTGAFMLLMPVCVFIFWSSLEYVSTSWNLLEGSREAGGLPLVFALKTCIPIMSVLLMTQGIASICRSLLVIYDRKLTTDV